jgi:1-aminocyclopropane-1-carboxylate deaminase
MHFSQAPVQEIYDPLLVAKQVRLSVKREDLLHPLIKGNKWYKLKYNLEEAKKQNKNQLLTFGGAYSNHIYATASAGKLFGFQTIGVVRGEETTPLNPILVHARDCGMLLPYLDRATYRLKNTEKVIEELKAQFGDFYLIPEGGTNEQAVRGTAEILNGLTEKYDYVCCACGTGGTLAGLATSTQAKVIGFAVLKGNFLTGEVKNLLEKVVKTQILEGLNTIPTHWEINNDYHFGGYAKVSPTLLEFTNTFYQKYQIPVEPIYTGKLFYGIFDLIKKDYFAPHSHLLAIHSGGVYA